VTGAAAINNPDRCQGGPDEALNRWLGMADTTARRRRIGKGVRGDRLFGRSDPDFGRFRARGGNRPRISGRKAVRRPTGA